MGVVWNVKKIQKKKKKYIHESLLDFTRFRKKIKFIKIDDLFLRV